MVSYLCCSSGCAKILSSYLPFFDLAGYVFGISRLLIPFVAVLVVLRFNITLVVGGAELRALSAFTGGGCCGVAFDRECECVRNPPCPTAPEGRTVAFFVK